MRANKDDGYITDGLVFHLDGIDKGTTDMTKWVDLVGGIVFTEPNGTSVHAANHIQLTTLERLVGDTMPDFPHTTHTIEAAVTIPNANWIFILTLKTTSVSLFKNSNSHVVGGGNGAMMSTSRTTGWGTKIFSFAHDLFVVNGEELATETNTWGNFNHSLAIINSNKISEQSYSKDMDIYSIRVYNRLLTADEMLHNQRYDNERFNLGLTL